MIIDDDDHGTIPCTHCGKDVSIAWSRTDPEGRPYHADCLKEVIKDMDREGGGWGN